MEAVMSHSTHQDPSDAQINALVQYARAHGRCWKADLCADWSSGRDARNPLLRQLRNDFGPRWLMRFRLPEVLVSGDGDRHGGGDNAV
jgi:hypothetical protein